MQLALAAMFYVDMQDWHIGTFTTYDTMTEAVNCYPGIVMIDLMWLDSCQDSCHHAALLSRLHQ